MMALSSSRLAFNPFIFPDYRASLSQASKLKTQDHVLVLSPMTLGLIGQTCVVYLALEVTGAKKVSPV